MTQENQSHMESRVLALHRRLAEDGDIQARYFMGVRYYYGIGVKVNMREALSWFRLAAEQGDSDAQYHVAMGRDFVGDENYLSTEEAIGWLRKAAEQGNIRAQIELANQYASGIDVARDLEEAFRWYLKAAEQGDAGAQYKIAILYHKAEGVALNYTEAVRWMKQAAEREADPVKFDRALNYYLHALETEYTDSPE